MESECCRRCDEMETSDCCRYPHVCYYGSEYSKSIALVLCKKSDSFKEKGTKMKEDLRVLFALCVGASYVLTKYSQ